MIILLHKVHQNFNKRKAGLIKQRVHSHPIKSYQKFNKYTLVSNISNTLTLEKTNGAVKKDDPDLEKLATQGTQDEDKQNKNTTQYVLDTTIRQQTQIT